MKKALALTLLLCVILTSLYLLDFKPIVHLELKTIDARFRLRGSLNPPDKIVLVTVDEKSLDKEGRWPWERAKIAKLLEKLSQARTIAIDLGFFEESPDDTELSKALTKLKNKAVLGYFFHLLKVPLMNTKELPEEVIEKALYDVAQVEEPPKILVRAFQPEIGTPILTRSVNKLGFFNILRDSDGTVRKYPAVILWKERAFAPLAIQTASTFLEEDSFIYVSSFGVEEAGIGERSIPVSPQGFLFINYYGPPNTFPYIPATDVIRGKVKEDFFRDKIVVLGATAMGLFDNHVTPFSNTFPGPEIHATAIGNILQGSFLKPIPHMVEVTCALIVLFAIASWLTTWKAPVGIGLLTSICLCTCYIGIGVILFKERLVVDLSYPVISALASFTLNFTSRHRKEAKEREHLKIAFSQYLSPELVERIIENPQMLNLGGEKRVITVMFSDIRNFTSISEHIAPEELVKILNLHFSEMTQIVIKHKGFVDKFIGDCVMAVFGAPIEVRNHETLAVKAAVEMVRRAKEISPIWERVTGFPLRIGVGINTGEMLIGNIGSTRRLNYTVLGDSVNLASRIEGQCKKYQVEIIASEFTVKNLTNSSVKYRKLDLIKVKGKEKAIEIYQVFTESVSDDFIEVFEEG